MLNFHAPHKLAHTILLGNAGMVQGSSILWI